ncbi:MAG: FAD-dependent oxidoreductase, partial [Candidatus Omnitrophica bacterium]|nr:FAD-dependent oxidoreductase [Candidatus Omnitrophota bacterium]
MPLDNIAIIGAGPAGMGCAYELINAGQACFVIDKENIPGGLCRTLNFHSYLFDIGGHRFLSKSEEINQLWHDVVGRDFLTVSRLSRIYYRKRYFNYPLSFLNTLWNLGPLESGICFASYCRSKILKKEDDSTFEGWIINRFGRRLFDIFFKTYTEKVWAVAPKDISADWARQRIRGLSLRVAMQKAIFGFKKDAPKTLSDKFLYPRSGAGEFYGRLKEQAAAGGAQFMFGREVTRIRHDNHRITALGIRGAGDIKEEELPAEYLFSSMPLPLLVQKLEPEPAKEVIMAAQKLRFRSFLIVNIILEKEDIFPDQWLYVHSPDVKLGRIQNYKNWSAAMVADPRKT